MTQRQPLLLVVATCTAVMPVFSRAEMRVLVSDGWPSAAPWVLEQPSGAVAVANVLQTNDLALCSAAQQQFNASVLFGPLPDDAVHGVFDRSHPKASGLNGLHPGWLQNLHIALHPVLPLLRSGQVLGIFMGDEIFCSNLPFSNYSAVLRELRALVGPAAVIWTNECGHPSGWPVAMWPSVPPELDWLSIDQYDVLHGAEEVTMAQRYWSLKDVKSKLHPHTRLLAVPGTFACSDTKYMSLSDAQTQVEAKLSGYLSWAKQDDRLIGLWPWHM
jgi:hypothetical protein